MQQAVASSRQLPKSVAVGGPAVAVPRPCSHHMQHRQRPPYHHPQPCQQSRLLTRAEPQGTSPDRSSTPVSSSVISDSDISFLFKLLAFSFAGAALIKYGSLAISLPFEPNAYAALTLVLGTPAAYSFYLLTKGDQQ